MPEASRNRNAEARSVTVKLTSCGFDPQFKIKYLFTLRGKARLSVPPLVAMSLEFGWQ